MAKLAMKAKFFHFTIIKYHSKQFGLRGIEEEREKESELY